MTRLGIPALVGMMLAHGAAPAAQATQSSFGALADGRAVGVVTLSNSAGMRARIMTYGAVLLSVEVPDRAGEVADVALGYATAQAYVDKPQYFGASVGRYANRIRGGRFAIDGKNYTLATNNGPNALHGGPVGFDKRMWTVLDVKSGPAASVTLGYTSADGEEGYPGALTVRATYALADTNELTVTYEATTTRPTVVNITNHSFFNLAGENSGQTILDHRLTIPAETTTPTDATLIPTGQLRPVAGTAFDFRTPHAIGERIRDSRDEQIVLGQGYDENFVLGRSVTPTPHLAARVEDPKSGRVLEMLTNQPGVQFYTGNFLDATVTGKSGLVYRQSDGLALEPQVFPDTPNQSAFGSARLDPGATYRNVIVYRFSTTAGR